MTKKENKQFDDVLKRMLHTPPNPHEKKKAAKKAPSKRGTKK
jgi:hypothetical protein